LDVPLTVIQECTLQRALRVKVTLDKFSGQTGQKEIPQLIADSKALSAGQLADLERLVQELKNAPPVSQAKSDRMRDAMTYKIAVEDGGPSESFHQKDLVMSEAFANLLNWLERNAT
jgi:hypothetical protein